VEEEIGMGEYKQRKALKDLEEKGFVTVGRMEAKRVVYFKNQ
jgi:hypothetical protein